MLLKLGPILKFLMQSTPLGLDKEKFENEILSIDNVDRVIDLHIWSISVGKTALSISIEAYDSDETYKAVEFVCKKHNI